jgi:hypothetical protein
MSDFGPYAPAYRKALEMAGALASSLEGRAEPSTYAVERLCEAVDQVASPGSTWDRQGFSSDEATERPPDTLDGALALAAADAQLMLVLFEASRAVGERSSPSDARELRHTVDAALVQLEALEGASASLAFGGPSALPPSATLDQAAAGFRKQCDAVFSLVIDECEQTIGAVVRSIRDHSEKVLEIIGAVGDLLAEATPRIPLLNRAWKLLLTCLARIRAVVQRMPASDVKALLTSILGEGSIRSAVERVLGRAAAQATITGFRLGPPLTIADLDRGTAEVLALGPRFSSIAASGRIVIGVLTLSAATIAAQFTGPTAAAVVPGVYGLVVAGILTLALDFTDRGSLVNVVTGVLQIGHALDERTAVADGV